MDPFDPGGTDYHSVTTMTDPLTGLPRLILGNDQGVWTILDNKGTFETQVGASCLGGQLGSPTAQLAGVDRNGNLQITQFYYGATQPSTVAAQIAGALFYGSAQDDGGPVSDPNIITDGNITWSGPGGDATGVGTDQQGLAAVTSTSGPAAVATTPTSSSTSGLVSAARASAARAKRVAATRPDLRPAAGEQRPTDSRPSVANRGWRELRHQPGQQRRRRHQLERGPDLCHPEQWRDLV